MVEKTWEERCHDLIDRIMATIVAGGDAQPLREELRRLMADKPTPKRKKKHGTATS